MKRLGIKIILAFLIIPALCMQLSGCFWIQEPPSDETVAGTPPGETESEAAPSSVPIKSDRFTLRYNPDRTLNPITCTDKDNLLITKLMYEGLFILDENFEAVPVLCESFETLDFITYEFNIMPDINMSDGTGLTADDVKYTLERAMQTGRYTSRLSAVRSVTSDGELKVTITLDEANSRFIKLLDIPIIKYGHIDSAIAPGTGPYMPKDTEPDSLVRFSGHRDFASLPIDTIYLRECGGLEVIELFADGEISLLTDDPGGAEELYVSRRHETRFYKTTVLQFIGFNTRTIVMQDTELRRAIGLSVDRTYIADTIMSGYASAAPLALPPYYSLYDTAWEPSSDPVAGTSAILAGIGLADMNNDSFLEYPSGDGGYIDFSIDFIVNSENKYKIEAANRLADTLRRVGFNITVRELPWDEFLAALDEGDFDMYYGETALTADFDLTPLLEYGAALDFGGTGGEQYTELIDNFLAAPADDTEHAAAELLCREISLYAPFIPVLYKEYAVHSVRGVVTGAKPTQSSVFYNLTDWTITPGGAAER